MTRSPYKITNIRYALRAHSEHTQSLLREHSESTRSKHTFIACFFSRMNHMVVSCLGPSNPSHHLLSLDSSPASSATQLPSSPPPSPRAWPKTLSLLLPLPSRVSVHAQLFLPPDLDRTEITQYPLVVILPSVPNAHQVTGSLKLID